MRKTALCLLLAAVCCFGSALAEEALPAYVYTGSDPVEAAVSAWTAQAGQSRFLTENGSVSIPAPVILKTEEADETHLRVYGDFWVFNYVLSGRTLTCISGGEIPAVLTLEKSGDGWTVAGAEEAGDGEDYAADLIRFSQGDPELEEGFFAASDGDGDLVKNARHRWILDYVTANGLEAEAYQDYGWDPVPLTAAPGM